MYVYLKHMYSIYMSTYTIFIMC